MSSQKEAIWKEQGRDLLTRSWVEVDLDRISENTRLLRSRVHRSCEIMGVVKADAYGHGVFEVVPILLKNGVNRLAVSMLDEAIELRQAGIDVPILVLSYTDPRRAKEILKYSITQTVYSRDLALALSDAASELHCDARIHIKIDTGMGRVGFLAGYQAIKEISWIRSLPNIVVEGLYTHFAAADEPDEQYTWYQFEQFMSISRELDRIGLSIPIKHVCNSAATMRFPAMHLDMVRPGLILYGMTPPGCPQAWTDLHPAMSLKTSVILCKNVPCGSAISYGCTYITKRDSIIATIPIGYADGYSRRLSDRAFVFIHGQRAPVVGRICMDTCMIDVTDIEGDPVKVGDEVILFAPPTHLTAGEKHQQTEPVTVDEAAEWLDTINYEVTCLIGRRVPRAYVQDGSIVKVQNYLLSQGRSMESSKSQVAITQ
ncbi:MAG: alanine racemase [Clostridia bacterium]|nr:alanine racemase [Clostridia bacterium]